MLVNVIAVYAYRYIAIDQRREYFSQSLIMLIVYLIEVIISNRSLY